MDISKWGFQNRNLVYFLVAVLLAGGALACYQMSKLEDPEIKVKLAMVATTYPGASAHQVELEVTDVLEKSIRKMDNVDNVESYSFNDLSLIQVELLTTVKDDDVEQHWDLLRRKVNDASALLPSGANTPIVQDDFGKVFGMFYALTGDGLSDREMADYAELIKREVIEIEGVDRVDIYGERSECINISLLQDRMANLGVKPAEVLATLNGQNETTYSGYYDNGNNRIRVTVNDRFKTVDDIGKMFIQGHDDDQLRLRDIALIEKGYEDPTRNEMFYNQERSIGILVAASSGSDIVKVGKAVEAKLAELKDNRLFSTCSLIPFGKTQAEAGITDEDLKNFDKYQGMPLGIESADVNTWNKVCCFYNPSLTQVTSTFPIITAARMLLIEAEAAQRGWIQADPAQLYAAGVKASFEQWGAEGVDEYLAQEAVAYTGTDADKINKIALQRWISGFMADGFEAWSDWRRFDIPKLEVGPVCTTIDHIPYRHQFDSEIYQGNLENYEAAVKADLNGDDSREQRVWWNRR